MKVKELVEVLQKMNSEAEVFLSITSNEELSGSLLTATEETIYTDPNSYNVSVILTASA